MADVFAGRAAARAAARARGLFAGIAIACLAAVGAALVSQHFFDMQPCPWCVLQRVVYLAIALACLIGLAWSSAAGRVVAGGLALLLALCGAAAALWQHYRAAASASCNLTSADRIISTLQLDRALPSVFEPRASCADAAVSLLGVPYDFWSLVLFVLIAITAIRVLRSHGS
ncbi:MAG: disulfide bond formation protein B [Burkholderiaceae bacterium]